MIYLVLGMHKSGTSLIAEMLDKAGISMVDEAQQASYEDGAYYERQSCYQLNMKILGWTDEELLYKPSQATLNSEQRAEMRAIIQQNHSHHKDWGFKDPRTCLTYPLWAQELPPHRLIVVFRPIEDIWHRYQYHGFRFWKAWQRAASLVKAWTIYNQSILRILAQSTCDYLVLSYRALLDDDKEFQRLAQFVERPLQDLRRKTSAVPKSDWLLQWAIKPAYQAILNELEGKRELTNAS